MAAKSEGRTAGEGRRAKDKIEARSKARTDADTPTEPRDRGGFKASRHGGDKRASASGPKADQKRAAEALAYNGLVQSWPEIVRLARQTRGAR